MDRDTIVARLTPVMESTPASVVAVYLYGSFARDEATADSDVDLGVLLAGEPPGTLSGPARVVEDLVERELRLETEAVVMNTASCDLVHRILRDGVLLLERDRAARVAFEVRSRNEYFDMEPIRRLYRRLPA